MCGGGVVCGGGGGVVSGGVDVWLTYCLCGGEDNQASMSSLALENHHSGWLVVGNSQ